LEHPDRDGRRAWLEAAGVAEGAVFRRIFNRRNQRVTDRRLAPRNVAAIVKAGAASSASIRRASAATACGPASSPRP
jgi:hypothetical protein